MRLRIYFLVLFLLAAKPAHSAMKSVNASAFTEGPTTVDLGAAIASGWGMTLPGIDAALMTRVAPQLSFPLYIGGEIGFFFATGNYYSGIVVPMLGTARILFYVSPSVHPTLGLAIGPSISSISGYTTAWFTVLFEPGVNIGLSRDVALNIQPKFGAFGGTFIFAPQMGASFAL